MMTLTDEPRAWVGCLACYNNGNLVGTWLDGPAAAEWTCPRGPYHEEFWCFDIENVPKNYLKEMSPLEFSELAEFIESIDEHQRGAVFAWMDNIHLDWRDYDESDFEEAYAGEWVDEKDYAYDLALETGFEESDSWPGSYIDWDAATRDLFMSDYYSIDNLDGGIWVFHNV